MRSRVRDDLRSPFRIPHSELRIPKNGITRAGSDPVRVNAETRRGPPRASNWLLLEEAVGTFAGVVRVLHDRRGLARRRIRQVGRDVIRPAMAAAQPVAEAAAVAMFRRTFFLAPLFAVGVDVRAGRRLSPGDLRPLSAATSQGRQQGGGGRQRQKHCAHRISPRKAC